MSADVRVQRVNSAGSDDAGLSEDEFIQRQVARMQTLMETTPDAADGSGGGLPEPSTALPPAQSGTRSAYEKLQALALAENLALDDPPPPPPINFDEVLDPPSDDLLLVDDNEAEDDDDGDSYEVHWGGGQLGLLFKADAAGRAAIRRVNKKGAATGLSYARAGDVLVALNGASVADTPFLDIIAQLKTPSFPVKLEFRPLQLSELAAASAVNGSPYQPSALGGSPTASSKTVDMSKAADDSYVVVPRPGDDGSVSASETNTIDSHEQKADDEDEEYDVVWDEGPLGCELKQRNGLPTVKAVTGTGTTPSVAQIAAGDILVAINGLKTEEIGFKSTVTLMMRATKPVYLRFHRARPTVAGPPDSTSTDGSGSSAALAPLEPQQYTVMWKQGPLGIQIRTSSKGHVVVSKLTGAGDPEQLEQVSPGDIFVRIAGVEVDALGIAGAFDLLKTVKKPVVLVFQKRRRSSRTRTGKELEAGEVVPSFRRLREEWANRQQMQRPPISRAVSGGGYQDSSRRRADLPRGSMAASYAGPMGVNTFGIPRTVEYDAISEGGASQRSINHSDLSGDFPSPRSRRATKSIDGSQTNPDDDVLPPPPAYQFDAEPTPPPPPFPESLDDLTDAPIESIDDAPPQVPPPPSYLDMFTQSGRDRGFTIPPPLPPQIGHPDDIEAAAAAGPVSPRSDINSISSENMPADLLQHPYNGTLPPSFDQCSALPLPPPPEYTPGLGINNARTRLQELRRQYIESERVRNQFTGGGYTFMDEPADLAPPPPVPAPFGAAGGAEANLPEPELWVRWTEGPLGITFKRKHGRIVVSRLTGQGYSPGLTQLRAGDWLVSFNNHPTKDLRLSQTMELLKRAPKPVDMCFIVQ